MHTPKSPTALMSLTEREKVFLEVHVQNLSTEPMCFERMKLECVDGWDAEDINIWTPPSEDTEGAKADSTGVVTSVFSGATAIMQPQDTRQYLYILSPTQASVSAIPVIHQPGSSISLGRLDISWRTGRLLTSVSTYLSVDRAAQTDSSYIFRSCPEGYRSSQCLLLRRLLFPLSHPICSTSLDLKVPGPIGLDLQHSGYETHRDGLNLPGLWQ